jgi:hypothetical protein
VLDLEAGVHLEEGEVGGIVGGGDQLDGAGADVAAGLRERDRGGAHPFAQRAVDDRRRRLLDDLLVAPLEAALALAEVDAAAVPVGQHLDLDVARPLEVALDQHALVAEGGAGLAPRRRQRAGQLVRGAHDAHPLAATAGDRLDDDRQSVLGGERRDLLLGQVGALDPRHDRHAGVARQRLRTRLVAHRLDRLRRRPDERDPGRGARPRQLRVLRQEAVAGVDRLGAGQSGGREHRLDRQVRLARRRRADPHRDVGGRDMDRAHVGVAVDRHRAHAELPQRARDPHGDLAAVGDQDGLEHRRLRFSSAYAPSARAITICWTSSVPSPIVRIFASR